MMETRLVTAVTRCISCDLEIEITVPTSTDDEELVYEVECHSCFNKNHPSLSDWERNM